MFNLNKVYYVANVLNIDFNKFIVEENIELEDGLISSKNNVTDDNIILTYNPNYVLMIFEEFLKNFFML